jgi:hypothetical protein
MVQLINAAILSYWKMATDKTFLSIIFLFKKYKGSGTIPEPHSKMRTEVEKKIKASLVAEINILRLLQSVQEITKSDL